MNRFPNNHIAALLFEQYLSSIDLDTAISLTLRPEDAKIVRGHLDRLADEGVSIVPSRRTHPSHSKNERTVQQRFALLGLTEKAPELVMDGNWANHNDWVVWQQRFDRNKTILFNVFVDISNAWQPKIGEEVQRPPLQSEMSSSPPPRHSWIKRPSADIQQRLDRNMDTARSKGSSNDYVIPVSAVTFHDLATLDGWLNDVIINTFLEHIAVEVGRGGKRIINFPTHYKLMASSSRTRFVEKKTC